MSSAGSASATVEPCGTRCRGRRTGRRGCRHGSWRKPGARSSWPTRSTRARQNRRSAARARRVRLLRRSVCRARPRRTARADRRQFLVVGHTEQLVASDFIHEPAGPGMAARPGLASTRSCAPRRSRGRKSIARAIADARTADGSNGRFGSKDGDIETAGGSSMPPAAARQLRAGRARGASATPD